MEDAKWYVVHTYSGYENKVAANIVKVVENRKMQDQILEVRVPVEIVEETKTVKRKKKKTKSGNKSEVVESGETEDEFEIVKEVKPVEKKLFPCYVFVKMGLFFDEKAQEMKMTNEAWYVVRNTRGVTGFVGPDGEPRPLSENELIAMGVEKRTVKLDYAVGDTVSIIGTSFDGRLGVVDKIDVDNDIVRVIIFMMGKDTTMELGLDQVKPAFD